MTEGNLIIFVERLAHPRRGWKPEFKLERYPLLDGAITKVGSAQLRSGLFMPAMNARVFNPLLKTFAERLRENGKTPKQVIVAIMRKLLHQIYGILKSGEPYNPEKRGFLNNPKPLQLIAKII